MARSIFHKKLVAALFALTLCSPWIRCQTSDSSKPSTSDKLQAHPFSTFAIGAHAGTLGVGLEAATPLSRSFNLRIGANFIDWAYAFRIHGINYAANLDFRSSP